MFMAIWKGSHVAPGLGDLATILVNHFLAGMILQATTPKTSNWKGPALELMNSTEQLQDELHKQKRVGDIRVVLEFVVCPSFGGGGTIFFKAVTFPSERS